MYSIEEFDQLKTKVLKYIMYKKRTENEVKRKFSNEDSELLEDVIEHLKEIGYINDKSYVERAVAEFMNLNNLSLKELKYKLQANIPTDGSIMSGYASVINKYAPHPCAAALAREYIFSDEGQANLAAAGAIPTRTDVEIPEDIQNATFKSEDYANAIPMEDTDAYTKACETVVERWQEEITPLLVQ